MSRQRSRAWAVVLGAALAMPLAGCGRSGSPGAHGGASEAGATGDSASTRERSQALIESGNQSFRTSDFALAARRYAAAAVVDPEDPAAYYGLGMALSKLGRDEQARVAYARARDLVREGRAAPASLDSTR